MVFELRSAEAEARYRHFVRKDYLAHRVCAEDDAFLAFADQSVGEAEVRVTKARLTLDEHTAFCPSCSVANLN
jgi:hypothetical protein